MSREWRPVGLSDEDAAIKDGDLASGRRVFTSALGVAASSTPPTTTSDGFACGGYSDYMALMFVPRDSSDVAYAVPAGSFTLRLYWYDDNSEEWIPETGTITVPHASAPAANSNHEEQRATYGKKRCAVVVEGKTDPTDILYVFANGRIAP